jgi:hypothetical protein
MMRDQNIHVNVTVDREELLARLVVNRTKHKTMYVEAVAGFKDQARRTLEKALAGCTGKEDVLVHLSAPQNMTGAYDTVIEMLQMHKGDTIDLSASEFRKLAQDKWDWTDSWLSSNRGYSGTVAAAFADGGDE